MPATTTSTLSPLVKKLKLWGPLDQASEDAILALPHKVEDVSPQKYLVREGEKAAYTCLLLDGFAYRQKVLVDGSRSIVSIHMKGDPVDLQNSMLGIADHSVQTLTAARVAFIPIGDIRQIAIDFPSVGMAMWYDTLVDGSIFREWIANVARRNAATRISHLLCEFGMRLESLGLGDRHSYELPMTQEQLADCTGLTPVHINRTLMDLESRGYIARAKRFVAIADWGKMAQLSGFNDTYLHLRKEGSLLPH
jgi:CRP-like cAMP-binding protein